MSIVPHPARKAAVVRSTAQITRIVRRERT
jgi:hypothetical protein